MTQVTVPLSLAPDPAANILNYVNELKNIFNQYVYGHDYTNVSITGGTIDGTVIGSIAPAAGSFTSITATSGQIGGDTIVTITAAQTLTNKTLTAPSITTPIITGGSMNGTVIGAITPAAASFTTLNATNTPFLAGCYNFLQYSPSSLGVTSDVTTVLQNFLLDCQLKALQLATTGLDNLLQRACVLAYLPRGRYSISCPIIVPEYVMLVCDGKIVRTGSSGTVTSFYTGDTTSKALANVYQPAVILVPRSHSQRISINCNSNGTDRGCGMAVGKNWTMAALGITNGGTGYSVNDVLTFAQPSLSPYVAATATVNTVDGSGKILTLTLTEPGAYGLPPVLQTQQWTTPNGFAGTFDSNGNLAVTGGTGTGASISNTWIADWTVGGGQNYLMGRGGLIADYIIDHVDVVQSDRLFDNTTYGAMFCVKFYGLNGKLGEFETQAGFYALLFDHCSDMHITKMNPVDPETGIFITSCSSIHCVETIIDTPTGSASALSIDNSSTIDLRGSIFFRNLQNLGTTGPAAIGLGQFSSGSQRNTNIKLKFTLEGAGAGGNTAHITSIGTPAIYLAYTQSYDIDVAIANRLPGFGGNFPIISSIVNFGSNVGTGRITGYVDMTFGKLYSGTLPPNCALDIMDGNVSLVNGTITVTIGGTATNGDIVSLIFNNANLASPYNYPRTVPYTVHGGDTTTVIAAALVAAINADPVLSVTGMQASNSTNVITISQMGVDANATVVTSTVSGSATETVTISNSGNMSGSISGGTLLTGAIYELVGTGAPTSGVAGTGWGKAEAGSRYTNKANGTIHYNIGSAASPSWT